MKRTLLAALLIGGLAYAQGPLLRPVGTVPIQVPLQPTVLLPVPTNTINRTNNSVFSASLGGSGSLPATGQVAYPQAFPAAANQVQVPITLSGPADGGGLQTPEPGMVFTGPGSLTGTITADPNAPSVSDYSCATSRPDFRYEPGKLNFAAQSTSDLGQIDMNFWSGLPPGTTRYVPLGEF